VPYQTEPGGLKWLVTFPSRDGSCGEKGREHERLVGPTTGNFRILGIANRRGIASDDSHAYGVAEGKLKTGQMAGVGDC
jgi:hypothetical protein